MIFKKGFLLAVVCFLTNCALKIGELAPPPAVFQLDAPPEFCSKLNFKKELSDYFFNPESLNSSQLTKVFECLSLSIDNTIYSTANEHLKREDITSLMEEKLIDFGAFNSSLDLILYSKYSNSFLSIKKNLFQIIKEDFDTVDFHNNFKCSNTDPDEIVISKSEALHLTPFLARAAKRLAFIEKDAHYILQSFFKRYQLNKTDLLSERYLKLFHSVLNFNLKNKFPEYSRFLSSQKKSVPVIGLYSRTVTQINIKEILPLLDMLSLPSQSNDFNVLNVKYMLFNIYLTQAFFNVYDLNKDSILSDEELMPFSCMLSPIIDLALSKQLDSMRPIFKTAVETLNLTELSPIIQYIISQQKIPRSLNFVSHRIRRNPEKFSYSLDHGDVTRLIALLFTEGLQNLRGAVDTTKPLKSTDESLLYLSP